MVIKFLTNGQLMQATLAVLLALTLLLRCLLSTTATFNLDKLSLHPAVVLATAWCAALLGFFLYSRRRRPVLLLNYSCYKPPPAQKCSYEVCEYFVRRSAKFTAVSEDFMRGIYLKSGLGDETYAPPFIFQTDYEAKLQSAVQEAEDGMFTATGNVLDKSGVNPSMVDIVIVSCGMFTPSPSLSSLLVNRFKFREDVQTFNLSGMGCSSGIAAIDLAGRLLRRDRSVRYALVVVTESISLNWYFGDNRSMLVTNCIFRVGTAAALLTNDPARRSTARMELKHTIRTHHGADDASYCAALQEEDEAGNIGIALTKDLLRVAGENLRSHIRSLAPRVLPISQILAYAYSAALAFLDARNKPAEVPDFTTAFDHICIHTGGKAVIERVAKLMKLPEEVTEPARMCLHRFGNTSSSLVFYELAYFDAKQRITKGDKMWMLAFGTGFKVCSLVFKAINDSPQSADNPWNDSIHRYPLKAW